MNILNRLTPDSMQACTLNRGASPGTISLGQGVVHYPPPQEIHVGLKRFFADPQNHKYRPVQGIPELLEAIRLKVERENGITLGPDYEAFVTPGAN